MLLRSGTGKSAVGSAVPLIQGLLPRNFDDADRPEEKDYQNYGGEDGENEGAARSFWRVVSEDGVPVLLRDVLELDAARGT